MNRMKPLACWLALVVLSAWPAAAVEVPQATIGEGTAMVIWLDMEQVSPQMVKDAGEAMRTVADNPMLQEQGLALPFGEIDGMVDQILAFHAGYLEAGGESVMMAVGMPGEDGFSPPFSMITHSKKDVQPKAFSDMFSKMTAGKMNAQLVPIAKGWHDVSIVDADGKVVTESLPEPDKKTYDAFAKPLGLMEDPVVTFAFRMQEPIRKELTEMTQGLGGAGGQQDPMMAMFAGVIRPLLQLDTVGFAYSLKENKNQLDVQMAFLTVKDAQEFAQLFNTILLFAPAMIAPQLQEIPGAPDPAALNAIFMKMQMTGKGDTLSLSLDQEFFDMAEKMAGQLEEAAQPADEAEEAPAAP